MNESDLQERIAARLRGKGPATLQTLASELNSPQSDVQSVVEKLQQEGSVRLLFWGFVGRSLDTDNETRCQGTKLGPGMPRCQLYSDRISHSK